MRRRYQWVLGLGAHGAPVGNTRIDMLRPELRAFHAPEIAAIRARFGDYVLFNSNFATVNNVISGGTRFNLAGWVPGEQAARGATGLLAHKRNLFERFQTLLPQVAAAIAPRHLVIRPHPSEEHATWRELASGLANVSVVFEGSVVPWIAGARVLIDNGCTSAVERRSIGRARAHRTPVGVWLRIFAANQRRLLKRRGWGFEAKAKARAAYRAHKFPGLTAEIADERIARFQGALSRFGGLRAREIRRDVLEIIG